jgi:hypothetical protein
MYYTYSAIPREKSNITTHVESRTQLWSTLKKLSLHLRSYLIGQNTTAGTNYISLSDYENQILQCHVQVHCTYMYMYIMYSIREMATSTYCM